MANAISDEEECGCGCGRDADECHDAWLRERRLNARYEHEAGLHGPGCACQDPKPWRDAVRS